MDLWVLPGPGNSKWFGRLDWYLNWQMSKGLAFERKQASAELFRLIEDYGLHYEPAPDIATPLLVGAQGRLPTEKCLVLQSSSDLSLWLAQIASIASGLKAQSLRIFLPAGIELAAAEKAWNTDADCQVRFSSDEEAL